jgi:hypothetical protein
VALLGQARADAGHPVLGDLAIGVDQQQLVTVGGVQGTEIARSQRGEQHRLNRGRIAARGQIHANQGKGAPQGFAARAFLDQPRLKLRMGHHALAFERGQTLLDGDHGGAQSQHLARMQGNENVGSNPRITNERAVVATGVFHAKTLAHMDAHVHARDPGIGNAQIRILRASDGDGALGGQGIGQLCVGARDGQKKAGAVRKPGPTDQG